MDLNLSQEHKMLQTAVRELAVNKFAPVADELDRKQEFAWDNFKKMAEMGLLGLTIPPEYGGSGGDELSIAVAVEEIGWACAATADILDAHLCLCTAPIYRFGNEAQKKKFVPPLARGEKVGSFAITEAEAGSDVGAIATTAAKDGAGYVLNGTKTWISNGGIADLYVSPTLYDDFIMSIQEAMAAGLPVVSTGQAFLVKEGVNGFVVPKRDPEPMAEAVIKMLSNNSNLQRMGKASRELIQAYSWKELAGSAVNEYREIIN